MQLWDNLSWLWALLPFAAYAVRFSRFVGMLGFLGPFAEPLRVMLEGVATAISVVMSWAFKSVWHCLFNPLTWGAVLSVYLIGGFYPAQDVARKIVKKRPAIAQKAAPASKPKVSAKKANASSETLRNFTR
ncbi:hypothetical protein APY04_0158 [Hyphomicrobium sulfonivorans]|uniref:Uncharacterized protein n=1 Tax=Hyphomicrobium sulfonivorans TaxID=121290 RepID=A0A109BP36_HYPSL|nr:hypothetical protein [Hyphomicrobium sulfonivorans]KWT72364.1 hypothetical protein APY04_0158 [Hyphomicrobium sulfonivorans]